MRGDVCAYDDGLFYPFVDRRNDNSLEATNRLIKGNRHNRHPPPIIIIIIVIGCCCCIEAQQFVMFRHFAPIRFGASPTYVRPSAMAQAPWYSPRLVPPIEEEMLQPGHFPSPTFVTVYGYWARLLFLLKPRLFRLFQTVLGTLNLVLSIRVCLPRSLSLNNN